MGNPGAFTEVDDLSVHLVYFFAVVLDLGIRFIQGPLVVNLRLMEYRQFCAELLGQLDRFFEVLLRPWSEITGEEDLLYASGPRGFWVHQ